MAIKRKKKAVKVDRKALQKQTKKDMQDARNEDVLVLRKKANHLLSVCKKDLEFLTQTKKKLFEQIKMLEAKEIKSVGAIQILELLIA